MFKKILVPLDQSVMAEAALPLARGLAEQFGCEVVLFHAIVPVSMQYYSPEAMPYLAEAEHAKRVESNTYLQRVVSSLLDRGVKAHVVLTEEKSAANSILDFVERNAVDLIVMSTHGRSGIGRWLMGSVTDKVIHGARVPLMLVRPEE